MRKTLLLLPLLMAAISSAFGQQVYEQIQVVHSAPSGVCKLPVPYQKNDITGYLYGCTGVTNGTGTWQLLAVTTQVVNAAPSVCLPGILYQVAVGQSGAGQVWSNSGTGTGCQQLGVAGTGPGAGSCTNQVVTAANNGAPPTCTTLTSAYVDNSIAKTGADINTSNQVTVTHLATALPTAQGGTGNASGMAVGLAPLETHTASNSASLSFTTAFGTACTAYEIVIAGITQTGTSHLQIQFNSDTGSNYASIGVIMLNGGSPSFLYATSTGFLFDASTNTGLTAGGSWQGDLTLTNAASTSLYKGLSGVVGASLINSSGNFQTASVTSVYKSTTAITSMQVSLTSGNMPAGTVSVYCKQ